MLTTVSSRMDRPSSQAPATTSDGSRDPVHVTVAVVGMGYVGLPTAIALRNAGHAIIGVDTSAARLQSIGDGDVELLDDEHRALAAHLDGGADGGFVLTDRPREVALADVIIVCVPTPVDERRQPDLRPLRGACEGIVAHARAGQTIILTSTTSVGTTRRLVVEPLRRRGLVAGADVFVAFAPERIDPGVRAHAQQETPRVVGGITDDCFRRAEAVLRHTCSAVHAVSSPEAAELCKLMENTFRATNIALSFEFAEAARHYGLDPIEAIDAARTKPYGFLAHYPSAGVGGHCIGVDPHYLLEPLRAEGLHLPVLTAALDQVAKRPDRFTQRVLKLVEGVEQPRVLVVGACYKPGVADLRESAALEIIRDLDRAGVHVDYHDPLAESFEASGRLWMSVPASAEGYDVAVLCMSHPGQDLSWLADAPIVVDGTYRSSYGRQRELI